MPHHDPFRSHAHRAETNRPTPILDGPPSHRVNLALNSAAFEPDGEGLVRIPLYDVAATDERGIGGIQWADGAPVFAGHRLLIVDEPAEGDGVERGALVVAIEGDESDESLVAVVQLDEAEEDARARLRALAQEAQDARGDGGADQGDGGQQEAQEPVVAADDDEQAPPVYGPTSVPTKAGDVVRWIQGAENPADARARAGAAKVAEDGRPPSSRRTRVVAAIEAGLART